MAPGREYVPLHLFLWLIFDLKRGVSQGVDTRILEGG